MILLRTQIFVYKDFSSTEHITLKAEATNRRLVSKLAVHIRPRKILLVQNQVTTEYCYEWLLCNYYAPRPAEGRAPL